MLQWGASVDQDTIHTLAKKDTEEKKEMLQSLDEAGISSFLAATPSILSIIEFCDNSSTVNTSVTDGT